MFFVFVLGSLGFTGCGCRVFGGLVFRNRNFSREPARTHIVYALLSGIGAI